MGSEEEETHEKPECSIPGNGNSHPPTIEVWNLYSRELDRWEEARQVYWTRMTTFLTLQGFLFAALALSVDALIIGILVSLFGLLLSILWRAIQNLGERAILQRSRAIHLIEDQMIENELYRIRYLEERSHQDHIEADLPPIYKQIPDRDAYLSVRITNALSSHLQRPKVIDPESGKKVYDYRDPELFLPLLAFLFWAAVLMVLLISGVVPPENASNAMNQTVSSELYQNFYLWLR